MFYAQSTGMVISGRRRWRKEGNGYIRVKKRRRRKERKWLYQGEEEEGEEMVISG